MLAFIFQEARYVYRGVYWSSDARAYTAPMQPVHTSNWTAVAWDAQHLAQLTALMNLQFTDILIQAFKKKFGQLDDKDFLRPTH